MSKKEPGPIGQLTIQTLAMPANTNANGDIFGGWLVSQMDLAAGVIAKQCAKGRITTVAIESMVFIHPVQVGDLVCCYSDLQKIGRTSMHIHVQAWVRSPIAPTCKKVAQGRFIFVAINEAGRPRPIVPNPTT